MKISNFSRISFIGLLLTIAAGMTIVSMVRLQIQVKINPYWTEESTMTLDPIRGSIYDRWGNPLAGNKEVYEIGVDLRVEHNSETIAYTVSTALGKPYKEIIDILDRADENLKVKPKESPIYVILTDFVGREKVDKIDEIRATIREGNKNKKFKRGEKIPSLYGLVITAHLVRSYPEGSLLSNVLGFQAYMDRVSGTGHFGVEGKYDPQLTGTPLVVNLSDELNIKMPLAPRGMDLVLTVDREIQSMLEKVIEKAVTKNNATSGTAIILDPKSGEILAMTSTPRLNLNEYWKYAEIFPGATPFNRAISQTYEPGSVFKVVTMAAALDSKVVTPDTKFLDTGSIEIGGYTIYNWDRKAYGWVTMTECMQHSLNVCLTWVAKQLGQERFYNYLQAFGIGHLTDIDLEGELKFPLRLPGDKDYWYDVNLGTNSFGQNIAVTPIQLAVASSALANGGKMMVPHIIKSYTVDGMLVDKQNQSIGSPIKLETANTINNMLAISLEKESSTALVAGYRVSGKTGTAEIPSKAGYVEKYTNASFVGWGPTDDPQFLVYLWLEKPTTNTWSSVVAAPVFSEIVKNLVVLMNLPPDATRKALFKN